MTAELSSPWWQSCETVVSFVFLLAAVARLTVLSDLGQLCSLKTLQQLSCYVEARVLNFITATVLYTCQYRLKSTKDVGDVWWSLILLYLNTQSII